MESKINGVFNRFQAISPGRRGRIAFFGVLLLAAVVRWYSAGDWSLWLDEVTCIYFSQHPTRPFPSSFPLFYYALRGLYQFTGISVAAGRLFTAALGVLSIGLTYACVRKVVDHQVAVLAGLFLALSFGHLFWSQAIRYYMLVFVFEVLSAYLFICGFEGDSPWRLVLSNGALLLGLLSHSSAALLIPVLVVYLALAFWKRRTLPAGYSVQNFLLFGVLLLFVSLFAAWRFSEIRSSQPRLISGRATPVATSQAVVLIKAEVSLFFRMAAYFGVPLLALAPLAPLFAWRLMSRRIIGFFFLAAFLPLLELGTIIGFRLVFATWYYAFFAYFGLAPLAALTIVAVYRQGFRRTGVLLGVGVLAYQVFVLHDYFTIMHGDRPRWKEAVALVRQKAGSDVGQPGRPRVITTSAFVVAFYLGVPADETMDQDLVKVLSRTPPNRLPDREEWYVVGAGTFTPEYANWLAEHCVLEESFEARTGPKDRTVFVYHYTPPPAGTANPP